MLKLMVINML